MKKLAVFLVLVVLAGVAAQLGYNWYLGQVNGPAAANDTLPIVVRVSPGETTDQVATDLADKGLIRNKQVFLIYARLGGANVQIQAGDYVLTRSMSMKDIADRLGHAKAAQLKVTIPEGSTAKEIGALAAAAGIGTEVSFADAVKSPEWAQDFLSSRPQNGDLEGFLFPDTYQLDQGATGHDLVKAQLDQFGSKLTPDLRAQIAQPAPGRPSESIFNLVILASIVEREANRPGDRSKVCSVLYNRLQNAPRLLFVDATQLYGLGKKHFGPGDIDIDNPYNTRKHPGLPPGPISNPGMDSLTACIHPENSPFFYYFTDKNGDTRFAKTITEFEAAKAKYGVSGG